MNGWLLKSGTGYYSSLVLTSAEWRGRYETIFIELETGGEAGGKGVGRASTWSYLDESLLMVIVPL
jgi:hypothetical protein